MRVLTVLVIITVMLGVPSVADADGGAYIALDHTYYMSGDTAVATAYVAIPKGKRSLLARGPFYAYVLNDREWLSEGRPSPSDAIRVGTFAAHQEDGSFELEATFTVPSLPPGWHHLTFCNDPCTIDGFREPLRGQFAIVETDREAELLIENGRLHGQLSAARRDLSKVERRLEAAQHDAAAAQRSSSVSSDQVLSLRSQLASARADAAAARSRSGTEHRTAMIVGTELLLGALCVVGLRRWSRVRRTASSPSSLLRRSP